MTPHVCWWNCDQRGSWSCCHMLNLIFDLYGCTHSFQQQDIKQNGVILMLHGGNAQLHGMGPQQAYEINEFAKLLEWVIFINIGDEQSEFPVELLSHPNSRLWLQTPLPSQRADRYLIEGYTHGTVNLGLPRDLEWFFAGQINHQRRQDCIAALNVTRGESVLWPTQGFGQGLPHDEYIQWMNRAKIIPCPSGPATPDSFRMAEALECGAIPIIDSQSLNPATVGFWDKVLPGHPLRVITDWKVLPRVVDEILADYEHRRRVTEFWWRRYKLDMRGWLAKDLIQLGAR